MFFDTCVETATLDLRVLGVTARVTGPEDLRRVAPLTPPWLGAALPSTPVAFAVEVDEHT